jgi:hypothetical protein
MDRATETSDSWREQFREVAARLTQPVEVMRQLLGDIIGRALGAVGAAAGSVLVPEDDGRSLRFLVSRGPGADKLTGVAVPMDASIAGHVFSTGSMLAFGDLQADQLSAPEAEVALNTGVATHAYLALPILHNGRAHGVATYVNRAGPPPHRPFQPAEMNRARAYTVLEGPVLRHLERLRQLDRFGAYDLAVAWAALDSGGPEPAARPDLKGSVEPWARMLQHLERLSQEDQDFCADLVAFVARRRDWEMG